MANLFNFVSKLVGVVSPTKPVTLRELIEEESIIGASIFGKPEKGVTRRFFLDDADNWFFSQASYDMAGRLIDSYTIRYQVLDHGVVKSADGKNHVLLKGKELQDLLKAVDMYYAKTKKELYETKLGLHTTGSAV